MFCTAETAAGRVQGLVNAGICQFKGVPYGASTGGANRFRPPVKPAPWTGIRECFGHGPVSPQLPTDSGNLYGQLIYFDISTAEGGIGEDCLHLNIWTPGLDAGAKRPVIVSIHGGGFAISSGNAAVYDGQQLAKRGDAVVVTVTHRLASFGYLDLSEHGEAASGAAGIMDLVAALEWVRDNIANFGGDPDCVTIMGQSGGGWKTNILLATPSARGLFHRAVVQSGSALRVQTHEEAAPATQALLAALDIAPRDAVRALRDLPWQKLLAAQARVGAHAFSPVLDGTFLTHHPCDPTAPDESRDVPLMVSTTTDDASLFFANFDLDDAGLAMTLKALYGDASERLLTLYRRHYPRVSSYLLQARIITDAGFRRLAYTQAERKAAQGAAPVYLYQWDLPCPGFDARFGAAHAMDVSAMFHNVRDPILGAGSPEGRLLADQLSDALLAFARTGNPNHAGLPHWPVFSSRDRAAMFFAAETHVENDPARELREFWTAMPAASVFG
ncbi:MAG TPA: carboxylesterase family protein [Rhizomicrobium sp.]